MNVKILLLKSILFFRRHKLSRMQYVVMNTYLSLAKLPFFQLLQSIFCSPSLANRKFVDYYPVVNHCIQCLRALIMAFHRADWLGLVSQRFCLQEVLRRKEGNDIFRNEILFDSAYQVLFSIGRKILSFRLFNSFAPCSPWCSTVPYFCTFVLLYVTSSVLLFLCSPRLSYRVLCWFLTR